MVGKPLWWALEQMGIVSEEIEPSSKEKEWWGEYVVHALVEQAADEVELKQRAKCGGVGDDLYSLDGFRKEFEGVMNGIVLSETDMKVLLRYLERDRGVVVLDREVCVCDLSESYNELLLCRNK